MDEKNNGTMRGFAEFTGDETGRQAAEAYLMERQAAGMRVVFGQFGSPNDNYLVKWYNPQHFRSFEVRRRTKDQTTKVGE